jgi:hypothetical protein
MKSDKLFLAVLLLAAAVPARAGQLDLLLDRLVEKNTLTSDEAQRIKAAETTQNAAPPAALPAWLQAMKFHGDLRLRSEGMDNSAQSPREYRGRIRLRFGLDAAVNDNWRAYLGLASGSSADSRSTNQTLTADFSKKSIWLDYTYAEYKAGDSFSFDGGRMHNPLWTSSDMLWDTDINPEGAAVRFAAKERSGLKAFANAAWFALDESTSSPRDPFLAVAQAGLSWHGAQKTDFTVAAAYYYFVNVKGYGALANRPSTACGYINSNTLAGSVYKYNYNPVTVDLELNKGLAKPVAIPLTGMSLDYGGLFGGGVKATDHAKNSVGWIAGFKLGQRKVEAAGQWQFRYSLRRLEADSWLDVYPDSDFYGGSTGVKGSELLLTLGLAKNMNLEADYYASSRIADVSKKEHLVQADLNLKF